METKQIDIRFSFANCIQCGLDDYSVVYQYYLRDILPDPIAIPDGIKNNVIKIVKCKNCGMVYVNPQCIFPAGTMPYDSDAEDKYFVSTSVKRKIAYDNLIEEIITLQGSSLFRALDIGCGDGLLMQLCQIAGINCEGLEVSDNLVQKLRERFGLSTIYNGNIEALQENSYDVVFLINVIEHLSSPEYMLNQIYRILKPGGLVAIHTPNIGGLPAYFLGAKWHQIEPISHLYYFNLKTMANILHKTGFASERRFYLASSSTMINILQQFLVSVDMNIGNGFGVIARRL